MSDTAPGDAYFIAAYGCVLLFIEVSILLNTNFAQNFFPKEMLDRSGIGDYGGFNPAIKSPRLRRNEK